MTANSSGDEAESMKEVSGKESEVEEDAPAGRTGQAGLAAAMSKLRAEYSAGGGHAGGWQWCPASAWKP